MKSPEFIDKMTKGPVALMTVLPSGPPAMGMQLAWWFIYSVIVSIFAGYIAGRALGPGAHYLSVFRFAGCTAFVGYSLALWQNTIWYKRAVGIDHQIDVRRARLWSSDRGDFRVVVA